LTVAVPVTRILRLPGVLPRVTTRVVKKASSAASVGTVSVHGAEVESLAPLGKADDVTRVKLAVPLLAIVRIRSVIGMS
jgi:hypothetical protein